MKIDSYNVGMDSARTYSSSSTRKLALSYSRQNFEGSLLDMSDGFGGEQYRLLDSDKENKEKDNSNSASLQDVLNSMHTGRARVHPGEESNSLRHIDQVRQKFVLYLWRMLFGGERADNMAKELGMEPSNAGSDDSTMTPLSQSGNFSVIKLSGIRENYFEEHEELSFSSAGQVTTADGRIINFSVDLNMSRSFYEYYREEGIAVGAMCDPLVLNFEGNVADLTDQKFYFDLDCDGTEEEISTLANGNAFLALDVNNDGIINDGSELFGTKSGDGFADLARYDSDGNGWIDENDSIFDKLKVWVKNPDGSDSLLSLKDKNVGAIYLGNASTDFGLRSLDSGSLNGRIRKTGIFLYEDGSGVGLMNHLDIAN